MKIKLTKEQSNYIKENFDCMGDNFDSKTETYDNIYFLPSVFIQKQGNDSEIFETKLITELSKEKMLEIISCILRKG